METWTTQTVQYSADGPCYKGPCSLYMDMQRFGVQPHFRWSEMKVQALDSNSIVGWKVMVFIRGNHAICV